AVDAGTRPVVSRKEIASFDHPEIALLVFEQGLGDIEELKVGATAAEGPRKMPAFHPPLQERFKGVKRFLRMQVLSIDRVLHRLTRAAEAVCVFEHTKWLYVLNEAHFRACLAPSGTDGHIRKIPSAQLIAERRRIEVEVVPSFALCEM